MRILVVRLGSMGDVIHTLPAVASLKHSFPHSRLTWAIDSRWAPLLEGNPFLDDVAVLAHKSLRGFWELGRALRRDHVDLAVDFQGLVKSAIVASLARPDRIFGPHQSQVRERLAALFYSNKPFIQAAHVVDRNLELAAAAGASSIVRTFPLPEGKPEGQLPEGDFVLANPLGGWPGKQWPLAHYERLAERLKAEYRIPLVLNGAPAAAGVLAGVRGALVNISGLPGLIDATRRALAVVGIDSGPLHLAAALGKPGVAIFGPTNPARNGPYGNTFTMLRAADAVTTYKRRGEIDAAMRAICPDAVFEALRARFCLKAGSTA